MRPRVGAEADRAYPRLHSSRTTKAGYPKSRYKAYGHACVADKSVGSINFLIDLAKSDDAGEAKSAHRLGVPEAGEAIKRWRAA
jgi:hypothetical protein